MSRAAKVISGLSIIFGLFGFFFGWKVRHSLKRQPIKENL
jgi:hypothetical protein